MKDRVTGRGKFLLGGLVVVVAIVYLISSSTYATAEYYLRIEEMLAEGDSVVGRKLRISGVVDGSSIVYDPSSMTLRFILVGVPADQEETERAGGLASALRRALNDPEAPRVQVVYRGPRPDLLRHEAQAIATGRLGEDGIFHADEILLKCPTRYEEETPAQGSGS